METRLQVRRRLLRITDSKGSASSFPEEIAELENATSILHLKVLRRARAVLNDRIKEQHPHVGHEDGGDDDAEEDDGDDENGDEEEEEEEEENLDSATANGRVDSMAASSQQPPLKRNDKCETSAVVKLLFSRHDPTRNPTVCFDYPPHLNVTREYECLVPSNSSSSSSSGGSTTMHQRRVVVLNAQDCPLFYKTHWERNCVKNAFAVAGFMRTKKKWAGWHIAWAKHIPKTKFKFVKSDNQQHAQVFNHFPDPWVIGRKDCLMKTLASYKRRFGASYSFFPKDSLCPTKWTRSVARSSVTKEVLLCRSGS